MNTEKLNKNAYYDIIQDAYFDYPSNLLYISCQ